VTADVHTLEIAGLGARGDGIADTPSGVRHVPFALPGERWRLDEGGATLLHAHPARATPPCRHFGDCGGCVAQHMPADTYAAWKRETVVQAFRHRGLDAPVAPLLGIPPASRRRVTLHATRQGGRLRLGFHRAATHAIVDLAECHVAVPAIAAALPGHMSSGLGIRVRPRAAAKATAQGAQPVTAIHNCYQLFMTTDSS